MTPPYLPVHPEDIPAELVSCPRWVAWRAEGRGGKYTKVPYNPETDLLASVTNPSTWVPFERALPSLRWYTGIGFVLAEDGIVAVDLDKCRDPETGTVKPWALAIVERLPSYTEASPSRTGLHIFLRGQLPPHGRKKGQVEMYSEARFIAVTGHRLDGTPATLANRQDELLALHRELWEETRAQSLDHSVGEATPLLLDDEEVISRAMSARNGGKFLDLWTDPGHSYASPSEADFALCLRLAFWTGRNAEQMDRLFRVSRRMRPKWDEPRGNTTYGAQTIQRAIAACRQVYTPGLCSKSKLAS